MRKVAIEQKMRVMEEKNGVPELETPLSKRQQIKVIIRRPYDRSRLSGLLNERD
jgi:hypothetical protein